ncbi:4Fe-4S dicluster domain-containing protein [Thiohalobacter sp. IOR34]|uniref:4Fe-4S dicluster domain-containing protein n=1 Tax=Thiohalobacter sp. IOR34 TaxID=3057176 RepID=UPI0025B07F62|nr:4Fe-4S dicluster domain-containing protein [Thiohalobacter sp. IOR34]WJW74423.1 4Fe-4S dicluster domain-containing protein [Thiohalobacter sp. IOR34]
MASSASSAGFLPRAALDSLIRALEAAGYRCLGPRVRDGAIVYEPMGGAQDLPRGVRDRQGPGQYRLRQTGDARCFAWANGPQALKPLLFRPQEVLWRAVRGAGGALRFESVTASVEPLAVIGVRACDLAALALQDQHFLAEGRSDPHYAARRRALLLIAVNCSHPAATCFCQATGDGPLVTGGHDLLLDELDEGFVLQAGSAEGQRIAAGLPLRPLSDAQFADLQRQRREAATPGPRRLPPGSLAGRLFERHDHPHWRQVAERCLSCGNCTAVCPSCFCSANHAQRTADGEVSEQLREWDSCFSEGHSYIHGITLRAETRLRYRQWLTHKFDAWHAQYGRSGCVGCGRCISWCPAGIDPTEELAVLLGEAEDA